MGILEEEYQQSYRRACREDDILGNEQLSFADRVIMVMLERWYPTVTRMSTPVQIWKLAKKAGANRRSISRFFESMQERGYMDYRSKLVVSMEDGKPAYKTDTAVQELEACKEPRLLNTIDAPKRKEHRKKVKERLQCRFCKSHNVKVKVVAVCKDCGKEQ